MSRTTILDRHEHVKINGFAHVSHIDGTYTHTLLDCLYFPDQERRYEFAISTRLRRCFDGFVMSTSVVSLLDFDFPQKRRCHACTGGTWCLLRWCGPPWVLFDAMRQNHRFGHPCGPLVHPNGPRQLLHFSSTRREMKNCR